MSNTPTVAERVEQAASTLAPILREANKIQSLNFGRGSDGCIVGTDDTSYGAYVMAARLTDLFTKQAVDADETIEVTPGTRKKPSQLSSVLEKALPLAGLEIKAPGE